MNTESALDEQARMEAQVIHIRAEVRRNREALVDGEEYRALCPEEFTSTQQVMRISRIALEEGWSFHFLRYGGVRFAPLQDSL